MSRVVFIFITLGFFLAGCGRTDPAVSDPATREAVWQAIQPLAERYRIEPAFIYALVAAESNFDPRARHGEGRGLLQLKPGGRGGRSVPRRMNRRCGSGGGIWRAGWITSRGVGTRCTRGKNSPIRCCWPRFTTASITCRRGILICTGSILPRARSIGKCGTAIFLPSRRLNRKFPVDASSRRPFISPL